MTVAVFSIIPYYTVVYCSTYSYTVLYRIIPYYTVLYRIIPYIFFGSGRSILGTRKVLCCRADPLPTSAAAPRPIRRGALCSLLTAEAREWQGPRLRPLSLCCAQFVSQTRNTLKIGARHNGHSRFSIFAAQVKQNPTCLHGCRPVSMRRSRQITHVSPSTG